MRSFFNFSVLVQFIIGVFALSEVSIAQSPPSPAKNVYVDDKGIMRWGGSNAEVYGFGVNYTVPFAHAYRAAKKLGVDHKKAIDNDVYHFARLGFDAYRVHVWDTEISDSVGNLIPNEHLDLFDYMVNEMKKRDMKFILTPIAFWGNGYPDPDEKTPGFASMYGKDACLTNEDAIKAQENYLFQFLQHKNPYTGIAYKDDPDIVAFEISNEPHHQEAPEKVTQYINRMVAAMRKSPCKKPIFYNISHSIHLVNAYYDADIQGGTFQWYPTGLGAQEELRGNLLPNVDRYTIPFASDARFKKSAKIVYEFDAADVGRSYIYPAMARSFRQAGIQWATHFAYDPTYMAFANTEYNTHYMNLVYTPQKALSLKLAAEVFHAIPVYSDFGKYPANTKFGAFRVSYAEDLAEMLTPKKFIYTNHTTTTPAAPDKLEEIAGYGNSAVVTYEGSGAYFLDRVEKGVWRLEVMPDAIWIEDPFGRNSLDKKVAVVNWREWPMTISLPDLGTGFTIRKLNTSNSSPVVQGKTFAITPGTYLLTRKGVKTTVTANSPWKNIRLGEFTAPSTTLAKTKVLHHPAETIIPGDPYPIEATIVSSTAPESAHVLVFDNGKQQVYPLKKTSGYNYKATLPATIIREGFLQYHIVVSENGEATNYPSGTRGNIRPWDRENSKSYEVRVVSPASPIYLFTAADHQRLSRRWTRTSQVVPLAEPGKTELRISVEKLFIPDPENRKGEKIYDYAMRYYFGDRLEARRSALTTKKEIVFRGRALEKPTWLQIALVTKGGTAYGGVIRLEAGSGDYRLPISTLKPVKLVTLPRPYPTFLPYWFEPATKEPFNLADVETLQLNIGPGIPENELEQSHGVAIESIRLE